VSLPLILTVGVIVKKRKQRKSKAVNRQRRVMRRRLLERITLFTGNSLGLPAWPSLQQLRDRVPGPAVVQGDAYRFEQSLQ
jgi:hypothetical protein